MSESPTIMPAFPSSPLNHVPQHHIYFFFKIPAGIALPGQPFPMLGSSFPEDTISNPNPYPSQNSLPLSKLYTCQNQHIAFKNKHKLPWTTEPKSLGNVIITIFFLILQLLPKSHRLLTSLAGEYTFWNPRHQSFRPL